MSSIIPKLLDKSCRFLQIDSSNSIHLSFQLKILTLHEVLDSISDCL